ncbi:MAG: FkbM family methyltransferase [Candidatus Hydrogenedentes bacterium]|nr:FkbM family methyltransferase [Candidatus Hydrogenedentota bacterium]
MNALFLEHLRGSVVEIDGHQFHLDPTDSLSLSVMGAFKPAETDLIAQRVQPGATVLDIGAHIGYFSLLFARRVGPAGHVYAFEPEPHNYKLLVRNVGENGYGSVTCVQAAAHSANGSVTLYLANDNAADHRVAPGQEDRETINVRALRVDDYLSSVARIDFIKIDVKGAELSVLQGMNSLLERSSRVDMLIEYWPFGLRRAGVEPRELLTFLDSHDFVLHFSSEPAKRITIEELLDRISPEEDLSANLYAARDGA